MAWSRHDTAATSDLYANNHSVQLTVSGGADRLVTIKGMSESASPNGATFNGVSGTLAVEQVSGVLHTCIYYWLEDDLPAAGTYTATVSYQFNTAGFAEASSYEGVEQGVPVGTAGVNNASISLSPTTAGGLGVDAYAVRFSGALPAPTQPNQTSLLSGYHGGSNFRAASSDKILVAPSDTMAWSGGGSGPVHCAAWWNEAAGAPPVSVSGAQSLAPLVQAGAAVERFPGTGGQSLGPLVQSGSVGQIVPTSTGAQQLAALVQSGSAAQTVPTADGAQSFAEREAIRGGLGHFEAKYLMSLALANAGRLGKYGA